MHQKCYPSASKELREQDQRRGCSLQQEHIQITLGSARFQALQPQTPGGHRTRLILSAPHAPSSYIQSARVKNGYFQTCKTHSEIISICGVKQRLTGEAQTRGLKGNSPYPSEQVCPSVANGVKKKKKGTSSVLQPVPPHKLKQTELPLIQIKNK